MVTLCGSCNVINPDVINPDVINPECSTTWLVIGYGNELRQDDGAGRRVADKVASWSRACTRVISVVQLTPDLAKDIAEVEQVVFVDACEGLEKIRVEAVEADEAGGLSSSHHTSPSHLLYLAKHLYNHVPAATWLMLPACDFDLGERLSDVAQQGVDDALTWLRQALT
ncbi:MAG: hydrogenase maturation protease [Deinococcota bacterium]